MTTQTFDGYYVFEADQVLTNDHLNQQFYYLDWQERLTRNKLIGTGIVCGLDITSAADKITISKGSGVTSEGYLIVLEGPATYDNFVQYKGVPQPDDLAFAADLPTGYVLPFFDAYCTGTTVYQLLDSTQYTVQNPMPTGSAALTTLTLANYAVVLFLELNEKDLKNCDTQDCNNKGEKMEITIRALLVPVTALPNPFVATKAGEIKLARYNVPYTAITDAAGVLNGFNKILSNGVLDKVAAAYAYCYDRYKGILSNDPTAPNPFSASTPPFAQQLHTALTNALANNNGLTIQYLYDYIDDLILAYYEFRETANNVLLTQCVGHELDFPLHLVLGAANTSTDDMTADPYRTYFIYSAIFNAQNQGADQVRFLFNRMKMMAGILDIQLYTAAAAIRITPSQYRDFPLSERCIPFYYDWDAVNGTAINQVWNYYKSLHGNEDFILGYNASNYNGDDSVGSPLLYDIEKYNFFRVEGHIGQKYQGVLSHLLDQRLTYNLPFDVVAISAELLQYGTNNPAIPACSVTDLDSEYRLLVIEFLSKIYLCFYKFLQLPYDSTLLANKEGVFKVSTTGIPDMDEQAFLTNFNPTFSAYKYGDFVTSYTAAASASANANVVAAKATTGVGTGATPMQVMQIGNVYAGFVKNGAIVNGQFMNPVEVGNASLNINNISYVKGYNSQLTLINAIDKLYYLLLNTALADLTAAEFTAAFNQFNTTLTSFETLLSRESEVTALFSGCGCDCLAPLAKEVLELLKEYQTRVQQYLAQLSFLNYYKKHPGLEHKSGVPKGGTFVLVYHEAPATTTTTSIAPAAPSGLQVEGVKANVARIAQPEILLQKNQYIIDDTTLQMVRKFVNDCTAATEPTKQGVLSNLPGTTQVNQPGQTTGGTTSVANDIVIADFYVPYLCCSDCSPIAYMINNTLTTYNLTGGGSVCSATGSDDGILPIQLSGSDDGVMYTLYNSSDPSFSNAVKGDGNLINYGVQSAQGLYTVMAVSPDGSKATMNGSVRVAINTPPKIFDLVSDSQTNSICSGSDGAGVDLFLNGSENGVQYQLFKDGGTTPVATAAGTGNSGNLPFTGKMPAGKYTAKATNTVTGCTSDMTALTISAVDAPLDQTVTGSGSYCSGNPGSGIAIGLKDSESGVTYQLLDPSGQVADTVTSTGGAFSFKAQTTGGAYSVTATNTQGCKTNLTSQATITILETPSSQINPPAISIVSAPAARVLTINLTAVETDLTYTYAWNIDPNFFLQVGMTAKQIDPRTWNFTSNVPLADFVGRTKGKEQMKIQLKVSNGQCIDKPGSLDLWAALVAFEQANG